MSGVVDNLIERLRIVKDIDPFNKQLLNDCYNTVLELQARNEQLEKQIYELAGTEQKL